MSGASPQAAMSGRWREHLPAVLILGSPAAAAGMTLTVALTDIHLLPSVDLLRFGAESIVPLNGVLAALVAAAGGLRVDGTVPTRIAVTLASSGFAATAYAASLVAAYLLIPGL